MNRPASSGLGRRLRPLVVFASLIALVTMTFSLPAFGRPAHAALAGVTPITPGPIDPVNGFPTWYGDSTGLLLQQCMTPSICATILPNPAAPPSFPNNFPSEVFYWRAVAKMTTGGGTGKATLTLATEGAFPNGVVAGQQTVFNRFRVVISGGLVPSTAYTVTTPYGVVNLTTDALGAAKFTQDAGCVLPPCSLTASIVGSVGPWLRWDSTAPAPRAGYIGDFAVLHAVTGSPLGTNFFRIEGKDVGGQGVNTVQTNLFNLQGQTASPAAVPPAPVAPTPSVVQLSPASLNFGSVTRQATPVPQRVTVTNTGTAVLTITRIAIGGANPGDFAIAANRCGNTLPAGASCTVDVTFRPTALGARSGTLAITDNAAGSPQTAALTGTGV
jgi:Abnormal spindle-like microcephaly-assoc'd, ASPM-SPD-2-Hydin